MVRGEVATGRDVLVGILEHLSDQWELVLQGGGELLYLTFEVGRVGLGEDCAVRPINATMDCYVGGTFMRMLQMK